MKHLTSTAIIVLLSIVFSANIAAKGSNNKPPEPDFSTLDTDGNGAISFDEFNTKTVSYTHLTLPTNREV